jgi:glycogen(starch) synthase
LAKALPRQNVNVRLGCPVPSPLADEAAKAGIPVVPIQKNGLLDKAAVDTLRRLLQSGEVDVVHSHNGRTAMLAAMAVRLARSGRCVATQHFIEPSRNRRRGLRRLVAKQVHNWVARNTDCYIAISRAVERMMSLRGDSLPNRIRIVCNGINPCDGDLKSAADVRQELDLSSEAPLVVCAARLQPEKSVSTLITAMTLLANKVPSAVCLIAGEGAERPVLERQINRLGLTGRVRLLGYRTDVPSLIAACDVFVLPSLSEPFGLVLLEAMSLSKPVVATAAGGALEIVVPKQTGLLVPPQQPEDLADAIHAVLSNPATANTMGRNGKRRFEEYFTAEKMAGATAEVYRNAVAGDGE